MKFHRFAISRTRRSALLLLLVCIPVLLCFTSCQYSGSMQDRISTLDIGNALSVKQPTPTDIDYSLERYNLIRRAYWVNGMREKAATLPCSVADVPFGYIVLFTESGSVVGRFEVDGKVTSLNSFLTPDSQYYESTVKNNWLPDVDGSYGENDSGIFFFTPAGQYIEWTGIYLYSDIPFVVENPVVTYSGTPGEK